MKYYSQLFFLIGFLFFFGESSAAIQNNVFVYTLDHVEAALLRKISI